MGGRAAIVADQENAVMAAAGVAVDEIGIRALDPVGEIGPHEEIEDAIDAVGRNPLAARGGEIVRNIVGARRLVVLR